MSEMITLPWWAPAAFMFLGAACYEFGRWTKRRESHKRKLVEQCESGQS